MSCNVPIVFVNYYVNVTSQCIGKREDSIQENKYSKTRKYYSDMAINIIRANITLDTNIRIQ